MRLLASRDSEVKGVSEGVGERSGDLLTRLEGGEHLLTARSTSRLYENEASESSRM